MTAVFGDSSCCQAELRPWLTRDDYDGEIKQVLACVVCGREWLDLGVPMSPAEIEDVRGVARGVHRGGFTDDELKAMRRRQWWKDGVEDASVDRGML